MARNPHLGLLLVLRLVSAARPRGTLGADLAHRHARLYRFGYQLGLLAHRSAVRILRLQTAPYLRGDTQRDELRGDLIT